jgi:hypothetical protein
MDSTQLAEYFIDWYRDGKKKKMLFQQSKELLCQELKWNLELLNEIEYLQKQNTRITDEQIITLIKAFEFEVYIFIQSMGVPLNQIFIGDFIRSTSTTGYNNYFENIRTNSELIQKIYMRLKVNRIRLTLKSERNERSSNYLKYLLIEGIKTLKPE